MPDVGGWRVGRDFNRAVGPGSPASSCRGLRYEGAFRLQAPTGNGDAETFSYGGTALGFDAHGHFGGTHVTGNATIPIITRTSLGPAASVFNPTRVGTQKVTAIRALGYPMGHSRKL